MYRRQDGLFGSANELLAQLPWLTVMRVAIAIMRVAVGGMAIAVVRVAIV
jgi:hypothetical protein